MDGFISGNSLISCFYLVGIMKVDEEIYVYFITLIIQWGWIARTDVAVYYEFWHFIASGY